MYPRNPWGQSSAGALLAAISSRASSTRSRLLAEVRCWCCTCSCSRCVTVLLAPLPHPLPRMVLDLIACCLDDSRGRDTEERLLFPTAWASLCREDKCCRSGPFVAPTGCGTDHPTASGMTPRSFNGPWAPLGRFYNRFTPSNFDALHRRLWGSEGVVREETRSALTCICCCIDPILRQNTSKRISHALFRRLGGVFRASTVLSSGLQQSLARPERSSFSTFGPWTATQPFACWTYHAYLHIFAPQMTHKAPLACSRSGSEDFYGRISFANFGARTGSRRPNES